MWIILLRRGNGQPPAAAADLIWGMEREVREECEWWHGLGVSTSSWSFIIAAGVWCLFLTGCGEGYVYVEVDDHESWVRRLEVHHLFLWRHVEHDMPGCSC